MDGFAGANMLSKDGEYYLAYSIDGGEVTLNLPGDAPYKADAIDPWDMTITSLGSVDPGDALLTPHREHAAIRVTPYAPGEAHRPTARAESSSRIACARITRGEGRMIPRTQTKIRTR